MAKKDLRITKTVELFKKISLMVKKLFIIFITKKRMPFMAYALKIDCLEIVVGLNDLTCFSRLNDSKASSNRFCTFVNCGCNFFIVKNDACEFFKFSRSIVVVDCNGDINGDFGVHLGRIENGLCNTVDSRSVKLELIALVITDDRTLCAVEERTHSVVSLTSNRNENLTDNVVRELHNSDRCIVVGKIGIEDLVV